MIVGTTLPPRTGLSTRVHFVLAVALFRGVLDICYLLYMVPVFENHFLTPMKLDTTALRYALSWLGVLVIAGLVPVGKRNLSGVFFLSAMMFIYLPITTMTGFNQALNARALPLGMLAIATAYLFSQITFGSVRIPLAKNGNQLAVVLCVGVLGLFVFWTVITGAIANINFDLTQIYTFREKSGNVLDVGVMAYVNLWLQKVLAPFLFALGLFQKKRSLIFGMVLVQVYFFAVTQHRSHLFVPVLIYLVYLLYKGRTPLAALYLYASAGLLAILCISLVVDLGALASVLMRRAFFVPASVTIDWIEFFQARPKVYFADNLLAEFSSGPYKGKLLPFVMGIYKNNDPELAFNTGLIGAGYAQAGVWGVILYAAILGLILNFINRLIRQGLPVFLAAAILIAPLRTAWSDSDLFTALLTHGVIVATLVLWLYGRPVGKVKAGIS